MVRCELMVTWAGVGQCGQRETRGNSFQLPSAVTENQSLPPTFSPQLSTYYNCCCPVSSDGPINIREKDIRPSQQPPELIILGKVFVPEIHLKTLVCQVETLPMESKVKAMHAADSFGRRCLLRKSDTRQN